MTTTQHIDTAALLARIDVRELIARDLGASRSGHWKCPLHNEHVGFSLFAYDDHWICYGAKCGKRGDAIAWVMEYHHLSFREACEFLGGSDLPTVPSDAPSRRQSARPRAPVQRPSQEWQSRAMQLVEQAQETLWRPEGVAALNYLKNKRGLDPKIIMDAGLGYIPGSHRGWKTYMKWLTDDGQPVAVPFGITIPHMAYGHLWGVRVRRAAGDVKYQAFKGGKRVLYNCDAIRQGWDCLLVEGEFDALIAAQVAIHYDTPIVPCALVGASNTDLDPRWAARLVDARRIFVRMDADQGGQMAAERLRNAISRVTTVQVPQGKDVNDFYLAAGRVAVNVWLGDMVWSD